MPDVSEALLLNDPCLSLRTMAGTAVRKAICIALLVCPVRVLGIGLCFSGDLLVSVSCVFPPESSKSPATLLSVSSPSSHRVTLFVSAGAISNLQCEPSRMLRIQACVGSVATARNVPLPAGSRVGDRHTQHLVRIALKSYLVVCFEVGSGVLQSVAQHLALRSPQLCPITCLDSRQQAGPRCLI